MLKRRFKEIDNFRSFFSFFLHIVTDSCLYEAKDVLDNCVFNTQIILCKLMSCKSSSGFGWSECCFFFPIWGNSLNLLFGPLLPPGEERCFWAPIFPGEVREALASHLGSWISLEGGRFRGPSVALEMGVFETSSPEGGLCIPSVTPDRGGVWGSSVPLDGRGPWGPSFFPVRGGSHWPISSLAEERSLGAPQFPRRRGGLRPLVPLKGRSLWLLSFLERGGGVLGPQRGGHHLWFLNDGYYCQNICLCCLGYLRIRFSHVFSRLKSVKFNSFEKAMRIQL